MVEGKPHRLAGDFGVYGFTGIRLLTNYMLAWVAVIPILRKDWKSIKLWLVSVLSFYVWQFFTYNVLNNFNLDPSGHIHCTLIMLSLAETQKVVVSPLGTSFFYFIMAHSCLTLYYTSYVFHSVFESYLGLTVGIIIVYGSRVAFKPVSDLIDIFTYKRQVSKENVFRQGDYIFQLS